MSHKDTKTNAAITIAIALLVGALVSSGLSASIVAMLPEDGGQSDTSDGGQYTDDKSGDYDSEPHGDYNDPYPGNYDGPPPGDYDHEPRGDFEHRDGFDPGNDFHQYDGPPPHRAPDEWDGERREFRQYDGPPPHRAPDEWKEEWQGERDEIRDLRETDPEEFERRKEEWKDSRDEWKDHRAADMEEKKDWERMEKERRLEEERWEKERLENERRDKEHWEKKRKDEEEHWEKERLENEERWEKERNEREYWEGEERKRRHEEEEWEKEHDKWNNDYDGEWDGGKYKHAPYGDRPDIFTRPPKFDRPSHEYEEEVRTEPPHDEYGEYDRPQMQRPNLAIIVGEALQRLGMAASHMQGDAKAYMDDSIVFLTSILRDYGSGDDLSPERFEEVVSAIHENLSGLKEVVSNYRPDEGMHGAPPEDHDEIGGELDDILEVKIPQLYDILSRAGVAVPSEADAAYKEALNKYQDVKQSCDNSDQEQCRDRMHNVVGSLKGMRDSMEELMRTLEPETIEEIEKMFNE